MKRNVNQQGVSFVIVLVIIAAIVGLAFAGWYVWHKNKQDKNTDKTNKTSQTDQNKDKAPEPLADPSEGGKYLVIKEWGVRFPLPETLRGDLEYGIFTFNDGEQAVYFASKELAAKSEGGCGLRSEVDTSGQGVSGGTVAVSRALLMPDEAEGRTFQQGNYWYTLGFSNGGTCYEGDSGQETGLLKRALDDAIRKLETIE